MSYSIYDINCDADLEDHICNNCGDDVEQGKIRSIAFIKQSYLATLQSDPTDPTLWETGIGNKDIRIIPDVIGSSDGGAPTMGPGYGDQDETLMGYKFTINFKDPNYKQNAAFYNGIKRSRNWAVAYRTSSQIHISDKVATIVPKAPITEDLNSHVVWDAAVTFSQADLPAPFDTPEGIFECFAYNS